MNQNITMIYSCLHLFTVIYVVTRNTSGISTRSMERFWKKQSTIEDLVLRNPVYSVITTFQDIAPEMVRRLLILR
ncbi:MAG: hypothetical protein ACFHU9_03210 [Fluviicola sp.]